MAAVEPELARLYAREREISAALWSTSAKSASSGGPACSFYPNNGRALGNDFLTTLFLVVLVLAWVALIIPAAWRAHQTAPFSATERFRKRLDLIAPRATSHGRWIVVPQSRDRLERAAFRRGQRRRTRILLALMAGVGATAVAAPLVGGPMWELQIFLDVSLALYVVLLVVAKQRRAELVKNLQSREDRRPKVEEAHFFEPLRAGGHGN
jgi:hypothetical protein